MATHNISGLISQDLTTNPGYSTNYSNTITWEPGDHSMRWAIGGALSIIESMSTGQSSGGGGGSSGSGGGSARPTSGMVYPRGLS